MHRISKSPKQQKARLRRIFITDASRAPDPIRAIKRLSLNDIIIIRDYNHPNRESYTKELIDVCHKRGNRVLIAGDARLARAVSADGLHLPEWQLANPPPLHDFKIITAACHTIKAFQQAKDLGVDAVLISSIFPTDSDPTKTAIGVSGLQRFLKIAHRPDVFALGGITQRNARLLSYLPVDGFAGISFFTQ